MRLIDADALDLVPDIHNAMNGVIFVNHPRSGGRTQIIVQQLLTKMIRNAPTIDAVPVVHGRVVWRNRFIGGFIHDVTITDHMGEKHTGTLDTTHYELVPYCSDCGKELGVSSLDYCPNCGAKMDANEKEEHP